jgi:hypothetical protein
MSGSIKQRDTFVDNSLFVQEKERRAPRCGERTVVRGRVLAIQPGDKISIVKEDPGRFEAALGNLEYLREYTLP